MEALRLYTVQVPHKRERRPPPCYLTKWDGKSFLPLLTQPCGAEVISCLSVRYGPGPGLGVAQGCLGARGCAACLCVWLAGCSWLSVLLAIRVRSWGWAP